MTAYVHDAEFFTRRSAVFAFIIALHVFILWALATGLARRAIEALAPPIQTDIVQEVKKEVAPPPPPPPTFEKPPVEVPPPDINIQVPVETASTAITGVTTRPVARPTPPPAPRAPRVRTGIGVLRNFPHSDDFYPPSARRLEQQGIAVVTVCVGPNGKLSKDPVVAKRSGTASLDEAAVRLAKAGSGRYKPATEDGKAVNACAELPVRFQLTD